MTNDHSKLKISHTLEQLGPKWLEQVNPSPSDLSLESRIKARVLDHIATDTIHTKRITRLFKPTFKKAITLAAVLSVLVGGTVGAIGIGNALHYYFKEQAYLVTPNEQSIAESMSFNGITMDVETAIVSNSGGLILFHLSKDDGTPFKEGTVFKELSVHNGSSISYSTGCTLSEDGNTLTYMINLKGDDVKPQNIISITGTDLVVPTFHRDLAAIDLSQKTGSTSLEHPYSDIALTNVSLVDKTLSIKTTHTTKSLSLWQMIQLVDTRTGKILESSGGSESYMSSDDEGTLISPVEAITSYKEITTDDLPYLKLACIYNTYEDVALGTWNVNFKLQPNENVKSSRKIYKIPVGEHDVTLTDIQISVLGGLVNGFEATDKNRRPIDAHSALDFKLILKTGETLPLYATLSSSSGGDEHSQFSITLEPTPGWNTYTDAEKEKITQDSLSNPLNVGYAEAVLPETLIDIEQVEAIEVNGVVIPLK